MATLSPRHRWMAAQIITVFNLTEHEPLVENLFRQQFAPKVDPFLKGTSTAQHLLFSYQGNSHSSASAANIEGRLVCSEEVSEDSNHLYVYFIRTVPFGKALNLSVSTDAELLFGEIARLPLQALHTTLSTIFLPAVEHFEESDWKRSTAEQQNELLSSTRKFCKELREAVDSLSRGVQLRRPDPRFSLAEINTDYTAAARNPEIVAHFEELLEEWCRQIEKYLEASLDKGTAQADAGPRSEQLKSDVCHTVFQVLHAVTKMIANCKAWLLDGDHHEALWERAPQHIIPMLQYCLQLNDVYHEQYRQTRERLLSTPKGKQLDVSEQDIFGRMDLFCRRLQKLITMVVRVSDLENALLPHISQEVVYSENLKAELKGKISLIVHRYNFELVQDPMKKLQQYPSALASREGKKTIKLYNRVAETLVEYELGWHQAWVDSVEATTQGLNYSLIARDPQTGKLVVNFDPAAAQLIREAKIMDRMNLEIPDAGRIVFMRENKLKHCYDELKFILDEYLRVSSMIRPVTARLLQKHLDSFEKRLNPGLTTLTWASLNIESFLQIASRGLEKLNLLVVTVNDIVENRIESNIKSLSEIVLVDLPAPGEVISLKRFVEMQEHHVLKSATILNARSLEIENAVRDLAEVIHKQPLEAGVPPYSADEENTLTAQYEWNLYKALLTSTKRSLDTLRRQIFPSPEGKEATDHPISSIFEVDLQLDGTGVRLHPSIDEIQEALSRKLHVKAKESLESLTEQIRQKSKGLHRPVSDIDALRHVMDTLTSITQQESDIEGQFEPVFSMYSMIDRYLPGNVTLIDKDEQDQRLLLRSSWAKLLEEAQEAQASLQKMQSTYKRELILNINTLKADAKQFREDFVKNGPACPGIKPRYKAAHFEFSLRRNLLAPLYSCGYPVSLGKQDYQSVWFRLTAIMLRICRDAVERVKRFRAECDVRTRKQEIYHAAEELFGFRHQAYPELEQTKKELANLSLLYDVYVQVVDTIKDWKEILWSEAPAQIPAMAERIQYFSDACKKLPKQLKSSDAFAELKKEIEDFSEVSSFAVEDRAPCVSSCRHSNEKLGCIWCVRMFQVLPLLKELSKSSILPRHWKQVEELTGKYLAVDNEMTRLQALVDANLLQYKDDIFDICESADKQLIIEGKLTDIENLWKTCMFEFGKWKTRDYNCILQGGRVAEIQEQLEESQMALNTMNSMRHVLPFKERVVLWTSLEPVFTGGDIAKQMPGEAKRFHAIDKDWTRIMARASDTLVVVECCQNELLRQLLPTLFSGLESCQKSLESYLEGKRNKFPRFYFVSNPVLLKILSQGSDAETVQDDLEKLFDAISRVDFDKADRKKITAIKAVSGTAEEVVQLTSPVKVEGNIEEWLRALEAQMQKSVRRECKYAAHESGSIYSQMTLKEFCDKYIAQVALLGIQMVWTADCQEALDKMSKERDRTAMAQTSRIFTAMMSDLVQCCLSDLGTSLNRTKYETLVTIHVHQRDVFAEIWKKVKEHRVKDSTDFEWLKQTRLYWNNDTESALISIADVEFSYCYEYLGVKERLAITPLTDRQVRVFYQRSQANEVGPVAGDCRCYLTCSQALGMFYGGAPAGPAGTGKTETVKDMGRTLGLFVVVTNCSDQHRFSDMAKIFKGLCQSGVWGCFDEFNRIDLEVLSVVAMQIESITMAKKQALKTFLFPGESAPIKLVPTTAYFITMNPGYAGRQELPENLKVLFRGVSMMVPDRQIIIKVKLASVGYLDIDNLSKKFKVLYGLCEEQLSKQRHYDFGLRNILSVLRTAGATKRSEPDADEEMLLMRRLVADDVPLFLSLLNDIFPRQASPPKKVYKELENAVLDELNKRGLVRTDEFLTKILQLYEVNNKEEFFSLHSTAQLQFQFHYMILI
ncbi:hypothetical protein ACSSS7_005705 [Eimeria intestinalis]